MGKIVIISENSLPGKVGGIYAENGFSAYIEKDDHRFIFDVGPAGISVTNNAPRLGINLRSLSGIILSHGHMDHTGGLPALLRATGKIKVYAHPEVFKDRYSFQEGRYIYVGMPYKKEALEGMGADFDLSSSWREIAPGVFLTGEIPRKSKSEKGDPNLKVKINKEFVVDEVRDDQALVIETSASVIVISGCGHAGTINTLEYVKNKLNRKINIFIGGTHLEYAGEEQFNETVSYLKDAGIEKVGLCHCSGLKAGSALISKLEGRAFFCPVGSIITI
ncbi:MAG: MBL fold metallo-hydrolase [Candidatus Aenigmatarchaeota archaeon]